MFHRRALASLVLIPAGAVPCFALEELGYVELARESGCRPSWLPTFGGEPGTNATVLSMTVFDDGSGPALYVGGTFTSAGGVPVQNIARWDGSSWSPLGSGLSFPDIGFSGKPQVHALAVHDDGSGPALYAGGNFTVAGDGVTVNGIARWNGSSWSALGSGISGGVGIPTVHALAVFDDGSGPALYIGGTFFDVGGTAAKGLARWDGASWTALGSGIEPTVFALAVYDDGSGEALYAGGEFTTAGGKTTNNIAKWNGSSWSALGSGIVPGSGLFRTVRALAVHDDGGGSALYAGGDFPSAGGTPANNVAKWNGSSWTSLGAGIDGDVFCLKVLDDGSGPALYAGGPFLTGAGLSAAGVTRWNGSTWVPLGAIHPPAIPGLLPPGVWAMEVFDAGSGPELHAGGGFPPKSGAAGSYVAKWDGTRWTGLGSGVNWNVLALAVLDDGGGPALHAGGAFTLTGNVVTNHVARWDGTSWTSLGSGMNDWVHALAVFDDGSGPALYAGGLFTTAGGLPASHVARWDGSRWSSLGSGTDSFVLALTVFDDGSGPALYAGGQFGTAGGVPAHRVARWDGRSWKALGSGLAEGPVLALAVFDDGRGPALYAGGDFKGSAADQPDYVARWDGSSWSSLGSGTNQRVFALTAFDDGSGPALCAGGDFTLAGGVPVNGIARWSGSSWVELEGVGEEPSYFRALTVFDAGNGPALYAAGGITASSMGRVARWDGSTWTDLGSGMSRTVRALSVFNDRTGSALHAGGDFSSAFDSGDSFLAKWGCRDTAPPELSCPASIVVHEHGGPPGEVVSFQVAAMDAEDYAPSVVCTPPSGSFFPPGTTTISCTAIDFSGNQATCTFPVRVESEFLDVTWQKIERP